MADWTKDDKEMDTREVTRAKNRLKRSNDQINGFGKRIGQIDSEIKERAKEGKPPNPRLHELRATIVQKQRDARPLQQERLKLYEIEKRKEDEKVAAERAAKKAAKKAAKPSKKKVRKRSRRPVSRFGSESEAALVRASLDGDPNAVHKPAPADRRFITSEQVGYVISNQWGNRKHDRYTPEEAARHWASSTLYKRMSIPSWVPSPYREVKPGDPSHTRGPIIVDAVKNPLRKHLYGSFGQDVSICVLDGKHRLAEHKLEHGDGDIEAYVGTECVAELERWIEEFGPKREAFVVALDDFYEDPNPINKWRPLIRAAHEVGLSDDQLRTIWDRRKMGYRFCPTQGHFVPIES